MNLGKLLFAGKSVVRGGQNIRYRESKQIALPKFVSPKNPFAPGKKAETDGATAQQGVMPLATEPVAPPVPPAPKPASWVAKWNPASLWHRPSAGLKPDARPTIQAELSLDTVKVVHNDLSDADVEVVPIKSRPTAEIPALPPAKTTWEILGERLLKATAL